MTIRKIHTLYVLLFVCLFLGSCNSGRQAAAVVFSEGISEDAATLIAGLDFNTVESLRDVHSPVERVERNLYTRPCEVVNTKVAYLEKDGLKDRPGEIPVRVCTDLTGEWLAAYVWLLKTDGVTWVSCPALIRPEALDVASLKVKVRPAYVCIDNGGAEMLILIQVDPNYN